MVFFNSTVADLTHTVTRRSKFCTSFYAALSSTSGAILPTIRAKLRPEKRFSLCSSVCSMLRACRLRHCGIKLSYSGRHDFRDVSQASLPTASLITLLVASPRLCDSLRS